MKKKILVFVTITLLLNLAGCRQIYPRAVPFQCADLLGCVDIAPGEPVKLGGLQTLSGGSSQAGIEQERSIRLAVRLRGEKILGHPIQLQFEDEYCSSEGGANGALRIVADPQIVAILGTNCSGAAVTAGRIMSEKGLVMISSANTSPSLTSLNGAKGSNWVPGYFRTSWNDSIMGQAAAAFTLQKLHLTRAAVINAGDAYTKGLTDVFAQEFTRLGGKIVLESIIDEDETDLHSMLDAVALSRAELIFFPLSRPETGSRIVRQASEINSLKNITLLGGDAQFSNVFIREAGPAGLGVYFLGPAIPDNSPNDTFRKEYRAKYIEYPSSIYYGFAYDAVNLLLNAVEKVAVLEKDGTLHIGRQALRDRLHAMEYNGLTGHLKCDQYGDCGSTMLNVVRLDDPAWSADQLRKNVIYTYTPDP